MDPTRPNEPVPSTASDPGGPGPGRPPGGLNKNAWILASVLGAIVIVLVLLLLLRDDDKKADVAIASSSGATTTSTTSTTTSTTASTSTSSSSTTTSTAPQETIPATRCNPKSSPAKPGEPATAFYDAWRIGDRDCAEKLGTAEAVNTMFSRQPNGPIEEFQGCTEVVDPEPHGDCAFTSPGGSTHLRIRFDAIAGWSVFDVYQVAD